jgi:hypothetical protein
MPTWQELNQLLIYSQLFLSPYTNCLVKSKPLKLHSLQQTILTNKLQLKKLIGHIYLTMNPIVLEIL